MQKADRVRPATAGGKRLAVRPVTAAQIPLHFGADYCLRCGTMFRDGEICPVVSGGPAARYRGLSLIICAACLGEPALDRQRLLTLYRHRNPQRLRTGYWPRYVGPPGRMEGFAKVSMLDNGLAFVGLHRGHVEPWRLAEVQALGGVLGSYSADYTLAGGPGVFYHQVVEVRFYDLAAPIPPELGLLPGENPFLPGGTQIAHHGTDDRADRY